jgi:ABC-type nickel/cobalt efflux system permease component RcnA
MRLLIRLLVMFALLGPALAVPVLAQDGAANPPPAKVVIDKRKLLVPPRNPDGSFVETPFSEDPVRWARDKQQNFYRRLSGAIRGLASESPLTAGWTLVFISFLYGVFHAAGPGHGKAVISGWLLATQSDLRRGIIIAALSALFQALTAIVIVGGLLLFVSSAAAMARDVAGVLESASYLMIAGLGLYLIWTAVRPQHQHAGGPAGGLGVATAPLLPAVSATTRVHEGAGFEIVTPLPPGPAAGHMHGPECGCGHAHLPGASELRGDWSWSRAVALAFAIGLRPCTGALLVLIFSWGMGLFWAGIVSTLAMGLGVFITISVIAALAVFAKAAALRFAGLENQMLAWAVTALRLVAGLGIAALGGLMFWASLGSVNAMM